MRPVLVGEDNPHSSDPARALAPLPRGAAGDRLRRILGMTVKEYLRAFVRVNLCSGKWSAVEASWRAERMVTEDLASGERLVLLGRKVAAAFGVPYRPFYKQGRVLCLPHPSGRCRTWNQPGAAARARRAYRRFVK